MSLLGEIRRRKVFQVAAAYAVVAWLLIQVVGAVEEPLSLPGWLDTVVIVLLGVGFPVAVILAWAFELTPAGLVRDEGISSRPSSNRLGIEMVLGALLIIALGWIGYRELGPSDMAPRAADAAAATDIGNSVAVLPFQNLSLDPENAFFAEGIHEEVLNQLAKLSNLRVISRTSVVRFQDSDLSIPEIAGQLNVRTVLEGSVRYANKRVRIAAQLIDASTDEHLWSEIYERDMADIFAIQADIAMNIANALAAEFSPEEQANIEAVATDSTEAYELYLAALAAQRGSLERRLDLVDRALELDPEFAQAWAFKALQHLNQLLVTPESDVPAVRARAEQAAQRAITFDPGLAAAHEMLARAAAWRRDWSTAEREIRQAVAIDPDNVGYTLFLLAVGKIDEAGPHLERARASDPLNPNVTVFLAGQHLITGDTAVARAELDRGFELFGDANGNWGLGSIQLTLLELGEGGFDAFRALIRALPPAAARFSDLDDPDAVLEDLRELIATGGNFALLGVSAAVAAALGDYDLALAAEDRAISAVGTGTWDLWKPVFREMRREPGFNELVEKHGLVEYWREYGWPDLCRPLGDTDFECF